MLMPECRNAGEKLVRHRHFFRLSSASVRHRYSGIRVQSGTAGHGLVQHCPALIFVYLGTTSHFNFWKWKCIYTEKCLPHISECRFLQQKKRVWIIYIKDEAFSPWFGSFPLPSTPLLSVVSLSQSSCVSPVEPTVGRGGGCEGGAKTYECKKDWSFR